MKTSHWEKTVDELTLGEYAEPFFVEGKYPILAVYEAQKRDYSKNFARWTHGQIEKHVIGSSIFDLLMI